MKNILPFILLVFWSLSVLSQDDTGPSSYEVQLVPASPEMSNLGKYGNQSVDKYTGTANINIPLHTIDLDGLKIPLALSYNTGGIRVNQEATWVGLGWNLTEGITITREVNGYDDLRTTTYTSEINPEPNAQFYDNTGWIYSQNYLDTNTNRISGSDLYGLDTNHWSNNSPIDFEPDLFTLRTPNGTCKFYLPKKGVDDIIDAQVINNLNFKVKYDTANFTFQVTDPDGFVYNFNVKEFSTSFSNLLPAQDDSYAIGTLNSWPINQTNYLITAWRPETIISPFGRVLNFQHEAGFYYSSPNFSETFSHSIGGTVQPDNNNWYPPSEITISSPSVTCTVNAFHNQYLTSISGDFGIIDFGLGNERNDVFTEEYYENFTANWNPHLVSDTFNTKRLSFIEVKNINEELLKRIDFEYSYFNELLTIPNNEYQEEYLRLKLNKVKINDQEYAFSYYGSNSLPVKDSKATDFWGFYNGANNNAHRVPTSNRFYYVFPNNINDEEGAENFYKFNGANRGSNYLFARVGSLKAVRYPTKGVTEFVYEGNSTALPPVYYDQKQSSTFVQSDFENSEQYNFRYQYLKLQQSSSYSLYDYEGEYTSFDRKRIYEEFEVGGLRIRELKEKDYNGELIGRKIYEYLYQERNNIFESDNRSLEYISSGKLMDELIFHSKGNGGQWEFTPENFAEGNAALLHSSNRIRTNNSANGSHIGYSRVVETTLNGDLTSNGYVETKFENNVNIPITRNLHCTVFFQSGTPENNSCQLNYNCWDSLLSCTDYGSVFGGYGVVALGGYGHVYNLGHQPITYEYKNGKITSQNIFENGNIIPIKTITNEYSEVERSGNVVDYYPSMVWADRGVSSQQFPIGIPYEVIDANIFGLNKEYRLSKSTTTNNYNSFSLVDVAEYEYGVDHNQIVKVQQKNSKGELYTTKSYFPQDDVVINEAFMSDLIADNRTGTKVRSEVFKGTELDEEQKRILVQRNTFSDINNPTGFIMPSEVITQKGDSGNGNEEVRQLYEKYDEHGNLIQYRKQDGIPVSFIWGFNGTQVLAKIEKAEIADIEGILGTNYDFSGNNISEPDQDLLMTGLPEAMVTIYSYKPLLGVTSIKDSRGNISKFIYDENNRLKEIRDRYDNLVEDYQYEFMSTTN